MTFSVKRYGEYAKDDTAASLCAIGGGHGGGSEVLVTESKCYGFDRAAYNQGRNAQYDFSIEAELSQTVLAKGPGGVFQQMDEPIYMSDRKGHNAVTEDGTAATLTAQEKERPVVCTGGISKPTYIVRRLMPVECARLQGFPDWWCADLDTKEPTDEEIEFWADVFETHRRIVTKSSKPKSRRQIVKWLQHPHSDAAEYKMWGNGVALPCVYNVMKNIADELQEEDENP